MGLDARKPVFRGLRATKAQTSLRICADWSAPLLFAFWKVPYLNLLQAKINFNFLASICSWTGWFESPFIGNPKDRLSRVEAHILRSSTFLAPIVRWALQDLMVLWFLSLLLIPGLEFAYTQAPTYMQGLIMGLFLMTTGLGSYVASAVVALVKAASDGGEYLVTRSWGYKKVHVQLNWAWNCISHRRWKIIQASKSQILYVCIIWMLKW